MICSTRILLVGLFPLLSIVQLGLGQPKNETIIIGHKAQAESQILAEMAKHLAIDKGFAVELKQYNSTQFIWRDLSTGKIDLYPEYTGTLQYEIIKEQTDIPAYLEARGLKMSKSLGFENSYALGMREDVAKKKGITKLSDLKEHPQLILGLSREFANRPDGWERLRKHYGFPHQGENVKSGFEHVLSYESIRSGQIDLMDVYTTDAKIKRFNVRVLKDDRKFFPGYDAIWLYRPEKIPAEVLRSILRLEGQISEEEMRELNSAVSEKRASEAEAAVKFLNTTFPDLKIQVVEDSFWKKMMRWTVQHIRLVSISLFMGILIAIPLGILATRNRYWELLILGVIGILQTIPALALLVIFVPLLGTGLIPALAALFLYSLLPIVRNTHAGLKDIPNSLKESAAALGLPPKARLWRVELPLASRSILAGIKTSAVINVGFAALGGFIGAGGFGDPINTGLSRLYMPMILQGAGGAAVLALLVQGLFELLERFLSPKGLRIQSQSS